MKHNSFGKYMRKHYRLFSGLFLLLILALWATFLDMSPALISKQPATPAADPFDSIYDPLTPTVAPTATPQPSPTPLPTATPTPTPGPAPFDFAIAANNFNEWINVRSGPGQNHAIIGQLSLNAYGTVLSSADGWTQIESGDLTGYCSSKYLLFGEAAIDHARALKALFLRVTRDDVVYRSPNTTSGVAHYTSAGTSFEYLPELSNSVWLALRYDEEILYISSSSAEIYLDLPYASPK